MPWARGGPGPTSPPCPRQSRPPARRPPPPDAAPPAGTPALTITRCITPLSSHWTSRPVRTSHACTADPTSAAPVSVRTCTLLRGPTLRDADDHCLVPDRPTTSLKPFAAAHPPRRLFRCFLP